MWGLTVTKELKITIGKPSSIFIRRSKGRGLMPHALARWILHGGGGVSSIKYAWNLNNPNGLNMLKLPW